MKAEQKQAIQRGMQEASAAAEAAAVAAFGPVAGDVCAALADLANQMKLMVQSIDGDITEIALGHAEFLARVKHGVCTLANLDQRAFGDMMFKIAESRMYIHEEGRKPNG